MTWLEGSQEAIKIARKRLSLKGEEAKLAGRKIDQAKMYINRANNQRYVCNLGYKDRRRLESIASMYQKLSEKIHDLQPDEIECFELALNGNLSLEFPKDLKSDNEYRYLSNLASQIPVTLTNTPQKKPAIKIAAKRKAAVCAVDIWKMAKGTVPGKDTGGFTDFLDKIWYHAGGGDEDGEVEDWNAAIDHALRILATRTAK